MAENSSLAGRYRRPGRAILAMLLAALGFFLAGLFLPFTAVTKLWIFENQVSVCGGLITLAKAGEFFLFAILLVFTVLFPLVKIISLLLVWLRPGMDRSQVKKLYGFVANLGKWSMLDVFVVAILVLLLRSGSVTSIKVQEGFYLFFASVMLTQVASYWTGRVARRFVESSD